MGGPLAGLTGPTPRGQGLQYLQCCMRPVWQVPHLEHKSQPQPCHYRNIHAGLGSVHFARRYFGYRVFFLLLRLLRCFSSPGSLRYAMYLRNDIRNLSG